MTKRYDDLTGQRFGRLVVLEEAGRRNRHPVWRCRCDCGGEHITAGVSLRAGLTKSCGCLRSGKTKTRAYAVWVGMVRRCTKSTDGSYSAYGGRGIKVCSRWMTFENFQADMGEPQPGMQIDRIDNNGHYEPGNCRWATRTEQARNKRNNRLITSDSVTLTLAEWAERAGVTPDTIAQRLRKGWPIGLAVSAPPVKGGRAKAAVGAALRSGNLEQLSHDGREADRGQPGRRAA